MEWHFLFGELIEVNVADPNQVENVCSTKNGVRIGVTGTMT